jgi:hypothetical protein
MCTLYAARTRVFIQKGSFFGGGESTTTHIILYYYIFRIDRCMRTYIMYIILRGVTTTIYIYIRFRWCGGALGERESRLILCPRVLCEICSSAKIIFRPNGGGAGWQRPRNIMLTHTYILLLYACVRACVCVCARRLCKHDRWRCGGGK